MATSIRNNWEFKIRSKPRYNIHQADIVRMRQMLTVIEWEDLLSLLDPFVGIMRLT